MFSFLLQAFAIVVFLASSLGVVVMLQYCARRFIQEEDHLPPGGGADD
jgi:hypothetical protein